MRTFQRISRLRQAIGQAKRPLGLVPTMGSLHEGHLSLVRRARAENATLGVSIFVNPTQFVAGEDFSTYPRSLETDLKLLREADVDLVFNPEIQELYPRGFDTQVQVGKVTRRLEGTARPGHFQGVATVVAKLFNIFQPDKAYFGQKDAQQILVIRKMVADLNFPLDLVVLPTVRAPSGLALSSRNAHLSSREREAAGVLWRSLQIARALHGSGERNAEVLRCAVRRKLESEPLAEVDYVSVAETESLEELEQVDRPALVSLAVRIGSTRLIDNILLPPP